MSRSDELLKQNVRNIEYINNSKKYAIEIEKVKSIDWETDIDKMDFSKLRNAQIKGLALKSVEYVDTPEATIFYDDAMCELIDFVKDGNKIIPPLFLTTHKIMDGIKEKEETYWFDGHHRLMLSNHLKLKQIPIVKFEAEEYSFRVEKWDIQHDGESVTFQSIRDGQKYSFDLSYVSIDHEISYGDILVVRTERH